MTIKGGTSQACAACKYQRRKCAPDCLLAPYFPADQPKTFRNAHRLYGVSNIMKILKPLTADQRDEAMKSIIYESNMRERDPVSGCLRLIARLQEELSQAEAYKRLLDYWIEVYRNKQYVDQMWLDSNHSDYRSSFGGEGDLGPFEANGVNSLLMMQHEEVSSYVNDLSSNASNNTSFEMNSLAALQQ